GPLRVSGARSCYHVADVRVRQRPALGHHTEQIPHPRPAAGGQRMPLRGWRQNPAYSRIWAFFGVLGPGLIAANADNDASGIYGYSLAGAQYQYRMLWVLVLSTFALGVAQEICAR